MKDVTYSDYLAECNSKEELMIVTGRRNRNGKRERRPIKESRFNRTKTLLNDELKKSKYQTREEAQQDLELKIQKMEPITFFLLRILIGWLIGKMLDDYFSDDQTV